MRDKLPMPILGFDHLWVFWLITIKSVVPLRISIRIRISESRQHLVAQSIVDRSTYASGGVKVLAVQQVGDIHLAEKFD